MPPDQGRAADALGPPDRRGRPRLAVAAHHGGRDRGRGSYDGERAAGCAHVATRCPATSSTALVEAVDDVRAEHASLDADVDLIVQPGPAPHVALPHGLGYRRPSRDTYSEVHNLTGWPAAVVRGGTSPEGLPIGVQLIGQPWREDVVLAAASVVEDALGGWQRPPI